MEALSKLIASLWNSSINAFSNLEDLCMLLANLESSYRCTQYIGRFSTREQTDGQTNINDYRAVSSEL